MTLLLGVDVGSSSVKVSVLDAESGAVVGSHTSPSEELPITSVQPGWAEQHPDLWWEHFVAATRAVARTIDLASVSSIGISYQMHGLVVVGEDLKPLRPAIIWCDSRAVPYGERAFSLIGAERCLANSLNSPGNFTAAKLAWVKEHEPEIFAKVRAALLPGDYIALRLTGELATTRSGLSEMIVWNFAEQRVATEVLDALALPHSIVPPLVPTFGEQGRVRPEVAKELGLRTGTTVSYRAGDQPNNALSLNVLEPGEVAATAGTSGVIYGVSARVTPDPLSRVNTFLHVNSTNDAVRLGTLLCVNGTAILNSWLRRLLLFKDDARPLTYREMDRESEGIAPGSDGLLVYPYGNGAERSLGNRSPGASIENLQFNTHTRAHLMRGIQEGIVFALNYGLEVMAQMGTPTTTIRAGFANMFLSPVFRQTFSAVTGAKIEMYETDGSQGAARGAGIGSSVFASAREAFATLRRVEETEVDSELQKRYTDLYHRWREGLERKFREPLKK